LVRRKAYHCPVEATIDVIGGKWKPLILWWLHERRHRFAELRRRMPGITERMLTLQLRELEADGIVNRRVYPTVPPRVEYSLTDYGYSLKTALEAICDWGRAHMRRIGAVEASPERIPHGTAPLPQKVCEREKESTGCSKPVSSGASDCP